MLVVFLLHKIERNDDEKVQSASRTETTILCCKRSVGSLQEFAEIMLTQNLWKSL